MTQTSSITIPAELDAAAASSVLSDLCAAVDAAGAQNGIDLEISDGAPTQLSLQLLFSSLATLKKDQKQARLGPNAARFAEMEGEE